MPEVKCEVANCYYWERGNRCAAEMIEVAVQQALGGDEARRVEFGAIGARSQARTSQETCCATFTPQERGPKPGIRRADPGHGGRRTGGDR